MKILLPFHHSLNILFDEIAKIYDGKEYELYNEQVFNGKVLRRVLRDSK